MIENQNYFKNFIEDDEPFDDYTRDMMKDGTWGGNLEIYALSIKFNVNFYIHILDNPILIVKNFDLPLKNVHLSYHNNSHYNSVRLKDDSENDIPLDIPLYLIDCLEQTTNAEIITNENIESDDEAAIPVVSIKDKEFLDINTIQPFLKKEYVSYGVNVKDSKEKNINSILVHSIMTRDGLIINNMKKTLKCHCGTNKQYKNCCINYDINGEYEDHENIFYCNLEDFKKRFYYEVQEVPVEDVQSSINSKNKNSIDSITKILDKIYI